MKTPALRVGDAHVPFSAGPHRFLIDLANPEEQRVCEQLTSRPIGELAVDAFAERLTNGDVAKLRLALCRVYLAAAKKRFSAKATQSEIKAARTGVSLLQDAAKQFRKARPAKRRGLHESLGLVPSVREGKDELRSLSAKCWSAEYQVVRIARRLDQAIKDEENKPKVLGERKARLRTLVEALADWWISMGKRVAITVKAKRRDPWRGKKQTAIVYGREGAFIALAQALFSDIDIFEKSEVEAAVTNVNEARHKLTLEES